MERDPGQTRPPFRLLVLGALLILPMLLLVCRLWEVQVHHGQEHVREIARQSIRPIVMNPVRGRMLGSDGTVLVDNRAVFDVVFHVSEMRQPGARRKTIEHILRQAEVLSRLTGRPSSLLEGRLKRHLYQRPAMPITVFTDLNRRELAVLAELTPPIAGMEIRARGVRHYPFPGLASQLIGVLGKAPPEKPVEARRFAHIYWRLEMKGRTGLELKWDRELSGRGGARLVRVNTLGYVHEKIGTAKTPEDGKDLALTIIPAAQEAAEAILRGHRGALVLLDAGSGAVLAMASAPSFDLSAWTRESYAELIADKENNPLLNRAVRADYTPGSIIKPLIALAALEHGVLTAEETYVCDGGYRLSPNARPIRCWNRYGHGELALVEALKLSCNPFFIHTGLATGVDVLGPFLGAAGFGRRPGLDYPGVGRGICPTRDFASSRWGRPWIATDTAFLSIGQGAVNLSPLQAAVFVAAIANGGAVLRPYLVQSILNPDGTMWRDTAAVVEQRLPVRQENLALIRRGMFAAVNEPGGTALRAANPAITVAGKTGTAEVGGAEDRHKDVWFIGFAPVEQPRYALAILVERGASGGKTAAPLAGAFFRRWLEGGDALDGRSASLPAR